MIVFAIPKAEAEVIDNWHVAGLQGTGSLDFSLDGIFVPAELTYELGSPAVRGGDLFRLGMPAFVSNEVPPLAIGLARRAIDDITELAAHTARFPGGPTVSERAVFHHELGRAEVRVRAARAVHREAMAAAFASAVGRTARRPMSSSSPSPRPPSSPSRPAPTWSATCSSSAAAGPWRCPTPCSATCATCSRPGSTSPSPRRTTRRPGAILLESAKARRG